MKVNDSGMPDVSYWETLFEIENIVDWISPEQFSGPACEVGCGYGTFTVPVAARMGKNRLYAYDIEPSMIDFTRKRILEKGLANVILQNRDVLDQGIDLPDGSCDGVLLFNLLHFKERAVLLGEAKRILKEEGTIYVIHWRSDIKTPRGPSLDIRPRPEDIVKDASAVGMNPDGNAIILEPYHWGIRLKKQQTRHSDR